MADSTHVLRILLVLIAGVWCAWNGYAEPDSASSNEAFWSQLKPYEPSDDKDAGVDQDKSITEKESTPSPNDALWDQIKATTSSSVAERDPSQPLTLTDRMLRAQSVYTRGRYKVAEDTFRSILDEEPAPSTRLADVARQWLLLSVMNQKPLPEERAEDLVDTLSSNGFLASPALWNLSLQLLLRQVATADPEAKAAVWDQGLNRLMLNSDGVGLEDATLAEIDRFIKLKEEQRGVSMIDLLTDLVLLTPNVEALHSLNRRRHAFFSDMGQADNALHSAWLQILLAMTSRDTMLPAIDKYAGHHRAISGTMPTFDVLLSAPLDDTGGRRVADRTLMDAAAQALSAQGDDIPDRRRGFLMMLSADPSAIAATREALRQATLQDAPTRIDELVVIESGLTGKLITPQSVLPLSHKTMETATRGTAFGGRSMNQQQQIAARALNRIIERRQAWAKDALDAERDDIAAVFWRQALTLDSADRPGHNDSSPVDELARQLHALPDTERSASVLTLVVKSLDESTVPGELIFLQATFLYEQGKMEEALTSLDEAETVLADQWDDDELLAAGLIRAVALIKLRRLDDAALALAKVSKVEGATEQLTQVAFLQGWIALNHNKPSEALTHFRRIVDVYPGSSFTDKARELIQRLEFAELTR